MTNIMTLRAKDIIPIRFTEKKFQHITSLVFKILLLVFLFQFGGDISARGYYDFEKYELKSEFGGISQRSYPDKAVDFLIENKIKGNFFNDFNSGAYLVGRVFPDIKVYIDGRTELYGGKFFENYQKIWTEGNGEIFEKEVTAHNITGVLMNTSRQHVPKEFLTYIYHHQDWALVYFDYDGLIFLKRVLQNQDIIDRHATDLSQWKATELDLVKMGPAPLVPYQHFFRAYTLYSLDLLQPALSEIKEALEITPGYGEAYHLIGQIYLKQRKFEEAFKNLRIAAVFFPVHQQVRVDLAYSYLELKEFDEAYKQAEGILKQWPNDIQAHYLMAEIYINQKKYTEAIDVLQKALALKPKGVEDFVEMGNLFFDAKEFEKARDVYQLALGIDERSGLVYRRLGKAFVSLNDLENARTYLEKALEMNAEDAEAKEILEKL